MALRVLIYAPHFAEYATRLAIAMSRLAKVMLVLEAKNRKRELSAELDLHARQVVHVVDFDGWTHEGRMAARRNVMFFIACFRPNIAHFQEQGDEQTLYVLDCLRSIIPIVLTVHDPEPHSGSDSDYAREVRTNLSRLRDAATVFHVHGDYCEKLLRRHYPDDQIVSTYHGVLFVPTIEQAETRLDRSFLFLGRMEAYKGLETFLDAATRLSDQKSAIRLTIAGQGPELTRLAPKIVAAHNVTAYDRFVPTSEVIALLQTHTAVVLPYLEATQSGILAAAFANACPVIASRVGGLKDVVSDNEDGLLIQPSSPAELSAAMSKLCADRSLAQRLSAQAKRKAETAMSWDVIARNLHKVFQSTVSSSDVFDRLRQLGSFSKIGAATAYQIGVVAVRAAGHRAMQRFHFNRR